MTQRQLLASDFTPIVTEVMQRYSGEAEIVWDVSLTSFPDPGTRGRFISMVILYMQIPGAVLGTTIANTAMVEPHLPLETVAEVVRQLIEATLASRSEQLAQMNGQQEQAHATGRPAPTGGPLLAP